MDFVAIDFETANEKRYSACSLGVVVVEQGKIIEKASWLIRPPELYFGRFNIFIHGIRPQNVVDKPQFNELWPELRMYLEGRTVIAHNAGFDMGVLRGILDWYDLPCPDLSYSCTRMISRNTWPGLLSYSLKSVADHLGIEFRHHDALEDAFASAEIARRAGQKVGARSLEDLAARLGISIGRLSPDRYTAVRPRASH